MEDWNEDWKFNDETGVLTILRGLGYRSYFDHRAPLATREWELDEDLVFPLKKGQTIQYRYMGSKPLHQHWVPVLGWVLQFRVVVRNATELRKLIREYYPLRRVKSYEQPASFPVVPGTQLRCVIPKERSVEEHYRRLNNAVTKRSGKIEVLNKVHHSQYANIVTLRVTDRAILSERDLHVVWRVQNPGGHYSLGVIHGEQQFSFPLEVGHEFKMWEHHNVSKGG